MGELEKRYRQSKLITERNQYHIIWLMAQIRRVPEVTEITRYNAEWVGHVAALTTSSQGAAS